MNEVSLIGYHGTDFANTHTILSDNYENQKEIHTGWEMAFTFS